MKKIKYHYNIEKGNFEPINQKSRILYFSLFIGLILLFISGFFYKVKKENELISNSIISRNSLLLKQQKLIDSKLNFTLTKLSAIEKKDDKLYRNYFNLEPLSKDERAAGSGGIDKYSDIVKNSLGLKIIETNKKLDNILNRISVESQSLDQIILMAKKRENSLANLPAIQPVAVEKNNVLSSGFGLRLHPILKINRMHNGLDFTAKSGTPVYSTGNGKISFAGIMQGYGNVIKINHNNGYETTYAHLSKILVKNNSRIQRGQLIGKVGSTGLSSGPHLHYEVKKDNKNLNPISFIINNISTEEYKLLIEQSKVSNQSLD